MDSNEKFFQNTKERRREGASFLLDSFVVNSNRTKVPSRIYEIIKKSFL